MDTEEIKKDEALTETLEEVATPQPEQQAAQEEVAEDVVPQQKDESVSALRFKTLRTARERAERERDELKAQLERVSAMKNSQPQATQPEDYSIAPDDFVEGKHLSKYDREIKALRQQVETYQQQAAAMSVETRLKTQYQDFDSVVCGENIEMLRTAYPEIAATINSSTDLYSKAVAAYTMIKKFGIAQDPAHEKQRNKAQENASKPRPVASVNAQPGTDSPLSHANAFAEGLTKDVKAQLYQEMLEAKKRR